MRFSSQYLAYLESSTWKIKRLEALRLASYRCQNCGGAAGPNLQVHHLNYERLGYEEQSDLVVLCKWCHKIKDGERRRSKNTERWNARVDGWASKKYGEDWEDYCDEEEVETEFEEWLENQE